jgi:dTDP-4-amino-4,6-dideoxygalactose transaminase
MRVPFFRIELERDEIEEILEVCRRGQFSFAEECLKFEQNVENIVKAKTLFVSSATAGLHIVYRALSIGKYDEVLVPSFTFVASFEPLFHLSALPVFVDVISERYPVVDIKDAEKKVSKKTRALLVMHYGGYVVDMKPYIEFCREHGLYLIEDAAHSFLVERDGIYAGTFGVAGVYSFYGNKNLPLGEGGMIVIRDNKDVYERARLLRNHGMRKLSFEKKKLYKRYDVEVPGFNFRPTEFQGALGNALLKRYRKRQSRRKEISLKIRNAVEGKFIFPFDMDTPSAYHLLSIFTYTEKERNDLIQFLTHKGIEVSHHYYPAHLFAYMKQRYGTLRLPVTEDISKRQITLPLYPELKEEEVDYIIKVLKEF